MRDDILRFVELLYDSWFFVRVILSCVGQPGSSYTSVNGEVQDFLFTVPWNSFAKEK